MHGPAQASQARDQSVSVLTYNTNLSAYHRLGMQKMLNVTGKCHTVHCSVGGFRIFFKNVAWISFHVRILVATFFSITPE